jgi:ATP-dependent Clp protease protease subunit
MPKKTRILDKTVFLYGEITTSNSMKCIDSIYEILDINEDCDNPEDPIKLVLNSFGGSVYDGFGLIGMIESCKLPIHTYAYGSIMSMALPIFVSGTKRFSSPYSTFMYHGIAWDSPYEKLEWHKQEAHEGDRLQKLFDQVILKRTKLDKKNLENIKHTKSEWYFGPNEAKKLGVVDTIL